MSNELRGRAVIVTGAGSGIGRVTAHRFADEGADVLAVGRSEDRLKETADGRTNIHVLAADVAAPDGPADIVSMRRRARSAGSTCW